jgi:hypothetical protein
MSMEPNSLEPLPQQFSPEDRAAQRQKTRDLQARKLRMQRRWEVTGEVASYFFLFLLSGAFVGAAYWYAKREQARPRSFPLQLQYASANDRSMKCRLEIKEMPPRVARLGSPPLSLPYLEIADQNGVLRGNSAGPVDFPRTVSGGASTPLMRNLNVVVPPGTIPGNYSGEVIFEGLPQRRPLKLALTVGDPFAIVRMAATQAFGLLTAGYLFLVWMRPQPRGWLLIHNMTPFAFNLNRPEPTSRWFSLGFFRSWLWLPGRNRMALRKIDSQLPSGEVVMGRLGLSRVQMKVEVLGSQSNLIYRVNEWPMNATYASNPQEKVTIDIPPRKPLRPLVVALHPEPNGSALSFSFRHPEAKS